LDHDHETGEFRGWLCHYCNTNLGRFGDSLDGLQPIIQYLKSHEAVQIAKWRKDRPVETGVLRYFPDALLEVAHTSKIGNDQHNPGQPLHWAKEKSTDHGDALVRHLLERGTRDTDGIRHSAKVAWRALALLQVEIDREAETWDTETIAANLEDIASGKVKS
jgi:hypothetical protein